MDTLFKTKQGHFTLNRYPLISRDPFQAWDAADEYILNHLAETLTSSTKSRILLINDGFGALTVALHSFNPLSTSDSLIAQLATQANLKANNLDPVALLNSLEPLPGTFDIVLIKNPKTLAFLEHQLIRIQANITDSTKIIVAGMSKYMPSAIWTLLERVIGTTTTLLAKKKAKLIIVKPDPKRIIPSNPYPVYYQLENSNYQICNHANVFSRESLDIGTRFLLQHLPTKANAQEIVDLGCGNGVVGLLLAPKHPEANLHFIDESYMAIASAQQTLIQSDLQHKHTTFNVADALSDFTPNSVDLIVCNPPFHQQNSILDQTALQMFKQSKTVLRQGGELWVIGNRHLGYHKILKRIFGNSTLCASNAKFVIIKAQI